MPSSIINSDDGVISGTSGLKSSGGDDGVLKIQNNGTDAVTVAANGNVTLTDDLSVGGNASVTGNLTVTGTVTSPSISTVGYVMNTYTSPATWTKPTGLKAVKVTVIGGGGGARGSWPGPLGPLNSTSAGGTSSFGAFLSATGGAAGTTPGSLITAAGAGSGGDLNVNGRSGYYDVPLYSGGGSAFGFAPDTVESFPGAVKNGAQYGGGAVNGTIQGIMAGGGGGSIEYIPAPSIPGPVSVTVGAGGTGIGPGAPTSGTGGVGVVIVEEFY